VFRAYDRPLVHSDHSGTIVTMAALATGTLATVGTLQQPISIEASKLPSTFLIDIVEGCLHRNASEWIFLRELRVGTGFHGNAAQRLDAYALNSLPHTSMRRVCYPRESPKTGQR
jgi:hypothetical protein